MGRKRHLHEEQGEQASESTLADDGTSGAEGDLVGNVVDGEDPAGDGASARVAELEAEVTQWKERALRVAADMENLRKRTQREAEDSRKFANERILAELLPVLDNFTRALEAAEQSSNFEALKAGVEQTQRQFSDVLTRSGLERIEAVGQPFDPNLHEAILQVAPEGDQSPNQVVEELRAGYRLNDRVVRPSLVKVTSG